MHAWTAHYLVNKLALHSVPPHAPGAVSTLERRIGQLGAADVSGVARMAVVNARV